jgi:hypothetical protein
METVLTRLKMKDGQKTPSNQKKKRAKKLKDRMRVQQNVKG